MHEDQNPNPDLVVAAIANLVSIQTSASTVNKAFGLGDVHGDDYESFPTFLG